MLISNRAEGECPQAGSCEKGGGVVRTLNSVRSALAASFEACALDER